MPTLRSAPGLSATMNESPRYNIMGEGFTDAIFLLGHGDGIGINNPWPVRSVRDALTALGNDEESPLVKALLETYFAGARDIWLVAVAPMSDYKPDLDVRTSAYYTKYRDQLNVTYDILKKWDIADIIVPLEAPLNSTVDFLGPLAVYCQEAFEETSTFHLGIIGTRGFIDTNTAEALAVDPRPKSMGDAGKYVSAYIGDAVFNFQELPVTHTSSVAAIVAAEIANLPLDRGMTYRRLNNVARMTGVTFNKTLINALAENNINAVGDTVRGRRGITYQVVPYSDNTMAPEGSDFWSLTQMRLVSRVVDTIHGMARRSIGTIGFGLFRDDVNGYLNSLVANDLLREFQCEIFRDGEDLNKVLVQLLLTPFHGIRQIEIMVSVGPSED